MNALTMLAAVASIVSAVVAIAGLVLRFWRKLRRDKNERE